MGKNTLVAACKAEDTEQIPFGLSEYVRQEDLQGVNEQTKHVPFFLT